MHEMCATTRWQPGIAALRAGPARIVVGIGHESTGQLCDRTSTALGDPLPVLPAYRHGWSRDGAPQDGLPALCRGVAVAERDLAPLPVERQ